MLRSTYYQRIGNPLQWARLPSHETTLRLPYLGDTRDESVRLLGRGLRTLLVIEVVDLWLAARWGEDAVQLLRLLEVAVGGTMVAASLGATGSAWRWPGLLMLGGLMLGGLVLAGGERLFLIVAGLALAIQTVLLSRHWTALCTTDPLDRRTANRLQQAWTGYAHVVAAIPVLAAVLAVLTDSPELFVLLLGACSTMQLIWNLRTPHCFRGLEAAALSWTSYNVGDEPMPGTFHSPAGGSLQRRLLSGGVVLVVMAALRSWPQLASRPVIPLLVGLGTPLLLALPVLAEASRRRRINVTANEWTALTQSMRESVDPITRRSHYIGRVVSDGAPYIVPRKVFREHAHFLGGSGAGKTSLGLLPWIEQAIGFGDCSIIVVDLKADSRELLATLRAAADQHRRRRRSELPLKYFSNQDNLDTFAFNPIAHPSWHQFNDYVKTDLLCGATGLEYGADYGAGFYSSANAAVLYQTIRSLRDGSSFRELADQCGAILRRGHDRELHKEIKRSGVHVHEVLKRLAAFEALNVTSTSGHPTDVYENAIDLADMFRRPQLAYMHLSATLSPGAAPAIARLVTYFLLAAATKTERKVPVYLVIDEFQRMVAKNTEYMLQLARSMGVGIILANQSMEDLRTLKSNLIPAIEANCRYRQWFDVPCAEDRRRVAEGSGETVEWMTSVTSSNEGGTISQAERIVPRLSPNDIFLASDHEKRSIVRLSRGAGYAQHGGLPVVIEGDYHISAEEYGRRSRMPWPTGEAGTFVPGLPSPGLSPQAPGSPTITTAVDGEEEDDPFAGLLDAGDIGDSYPRPRWEN